MNRPGDHEVYEGEDAAIASAFKKSIVVIFSLLAMVSIVGLGYFLWPKPEVEEQVGELVAPVDRGVPEVELPRLQFKDMTESAGIDFVHVNGAQGLKLLPETMGAGVACFDFDNDLDADLLFVNSDYWPDDEGDDRPRATLRLYENQGDWNFKDVTEAAALNLNFYGMGVAVADYDGDGWRDLFLTSVGRNYLLKNEAGVFSDVTSEAGVAGGEDEWSTSCGWFDYDRDGHLDLLVGNYVDWSRELNLQLKPTLDGKNRAYAPPTQFKGRFPYLYHNNGDGTFGEVAEAAGMHVRNPATGVPVPKALGTSFVDFNQDGWVDVFVANDTTPNLLFENKKDGTFDEIGQLLGVAFDGRGMPRGAMGIDAAYHRNDENLSIAIGNFADEATSLYVLQGRGVFTDESTSTGLGPQTQEELTFGVLWLDYDLDGRLDFLAANGHLENEIEKIRESQRYEQMPHLFWNAGPENPDEFISVDEAHCGADLCRPMVGRGSATADFDGDGDLDVVIVGCGQKPRLLRNDQDLGNHWLRIRLRDRGKNWEAIGAQIQIQLGEERLTRVISPTRSYLSQSEPVASFGLGQASEIEQIAVVWPDGEKVEYPVEAVDQMIEITRE